MDWPSRRQFLAAAVAAGASGCLGDDATGTDAAETDPSPATPTPQTDTASPTPADGDTPTATDPSTDSPTETPSEPPAVAWRRGFDAAVTAQPAVGDDVVVVGSEAGTVRAYDPDGERLWAVEHADPVQDLAVAGETVLGLVGTNELASGQTIVALDAASGDERWTFSPTDWWLEVLAVDGGTAYVATADDVLEESGETLYALALDGGDPEWEAGIGDPREAVLTDDAVFVSATGRTYGIDRADGAERWGRPAEDVFGTLATVGSTVVCAVESDQEGRYSDLLGIDAASGEERWRFDSWSVTSTVTGDGDLFVGGARTARLTPRD